MSRARVIAAMRGQSIPIGTTIASSTAATAATGIHCRTNPARPWLPRLSRLSDTAITWTAGNGAGVKPDHFDQWSFETDGADQAGTFTFKVSLTFADGKTDDVQVPVTVEAGGKTVASTTGGTSVAATRAAHDARSRANTALVVGIVAAVIAVVALAARRPRRTGASVGSSTDRGQDW